MFNENVKLLGRTIIKRDKLYIRDSYSGISFYCKGGVKLTITPDSEADKDSCPYLGVVIDDDLAGVTKIEINKKLKDIYIVKNDGNLHKVDVVKLTEEQYGNICLSDLCFEDEASVRRTETADKRILFLFNISFFDLSYLFFYTKINLICLHILK